jgi:hypothetical protein
LEEISVLNTYITIYYSKPIYDINIFKKKKMHKNKRRRKGRGKREVEGEREEGGGIPIKE